MVRENCQELIFTDIEPIPWNDDSIYESAEYQDLKEARRAHQEQNTTESAKQLAEANARFEQRNRTFSRIYSDHCRPGTILRASVSYQSDPIFVLIGHISTSGGQCNCCEFGSAVETLITGYAKLELPQYVAR